MAHTEKTQAVDQPKRLGGIVTLVIAMVGAPTTWALHFNVMYFLVQPVCRLGGEMAFHVVSVVALVLVAASAIVAWRVGARYPGNLGDALEGRGDWRGFVGYYGVASAALFGYAIVYQWSPVFTMDACTGILSV